MRVWPGVKGSPGCIDVIVNGWGAGKLVEAPIPSFDPDGGEVGDRFDGAGRVDK